MRLMKCLFSIIILLLLVRGAAYAHRPVIVKNKSSKENPVEVNEPEISWAFFGELQGAPHYYKIISQEPFNLYVNILVPDLSPDGAAVTKHDMSFHVFHDNVLIFTAQGLNEEWRRYYEEYGRDHYYWGPELDRNVDTGTYYVEIFNSNNNGKYSLAIGKVEKFNFFSLMGAIIKAKSLDRWFFK